MTTTKKTKKRPPTHVRQLVQDPENARVHNERNLGMIQASLEDVGAGRSVVIDGQNILVSGNGVARSATAAGITKVLTVDADRDTLVAVRRSDLSPSERRRMALFDNRTTDLSTWDPEQLHRFQEDGEDLSVFFKRDELTGLFRDLISKGKTDPDGVPKKRATDIRAGDLFELGDHRLLCGDSTKGEDVARLMDGEKADAVVTDPPYGINRDGVSNDDPGGLSLLFSGVLSLLPCDEAIIIAFQSARLFTVWLDAVREQGHKFERMLWMYDESDITFPWRGWLMCSQAILVSSVGHPTWLEVKPYAHDCYLNKTAGRETEGGDHPTVKPIAITVDLLSRLGGQATYDPFVGSGTTLIAAEQLDRRCYAIEIEPSYCQVTIDRWEAFTGKTAKKVGSSRRSLSRKRAKPVTKRAKLR